MGLDTVELVMTFEKKFKVDIPNLEAEEMTTAESAANGFLRYIRLETPDRKISDGVFEKLNSIMKELHWTKTDLQPDQLLKEFVPVAKLKESWIVLQEKLQMKIPKLNTSDFGKPSKPKKFLGITFFTPTDPVLNSMVSRFIDCICALNHESLVDVDHLTSKYEILVTIMGITSEFCGIDIDEIYPNSTFTNDLGMD